MELFPDHAVDVMERQPHAIRHLEGIGTAEGTLSLLDTPYLVQEWGLPSPLVLLTGDGHWWIALDYRECGPDCEPSVTWFDTELDQELHLAADFRTFVEGLTHEPDDERRRETPGRSH